MNKYETVMIINNEITKEQRNNVIARVKKYILENGTITEERDLGEKTLDMKLISTKKVTTT